MEIGSSGAKQIEVVLGSVHHSDGDDDVHL
jgi:hypothetical protein